jgi:hypothetical protein
VDQPTTDSITITDLLRPERRQDETFDAYRQRRKAAHLYLKQRRHRPAPESGLINRK